MGSISRILIYDLASQANKSDSSRSGCRYNVIDTVSEYQLLLDNFQNSTACAGFNIKTTTVDYR